MWKQIKWILLAVVSGVSLALAWLYGKKTTQVMHSQLVEKEAAVESLRHQIDATKAAAKRMVSVEKVSKAAAKVESLELRLNQVRQAKAAALKSNGALTNDQLAAMDNARIRASGTR